MTQNRGMVGKTKFVLFIVILILLSLDSEDFLFLLYFPRLNSIRQKWSLLPCIYAICQCSLKVCLISKTSDRFTFDSKYFGAFNACRMPGKFSINGNECERKGNQSAIYSLRKRPIYPHFSVFSISFG